METNTPYQPTEPQTRMVFRVLAGIIAVFLLLVALPVAVLGDSGHETWYTWFNALCCFFGGVGMAVGARTGRWPFALRTHHRND